MWSYLLFIFLIFIINHKINIYILILACSVRICISISLLQMYQRFFLANTIIKHEIIFQVQSSEDKKYFFCFLWYTLFYFFPDMLCICFLLIRIFPSDVLIPWNSFLVSRKYLLPPSVSYICQESLKCQRSSAMHSFILLSHSFLINYARVLWPY